jgi:hypothetical protein
MEEINSDARKSCSCKCWGKCWFVTISVFAWVIGVGALGVAAYCGINGKSAIDEYNNMKNQDEEVVKKLKIAEIEIENYTRQIKQVKQDIDKEKANLQLAQDELNKTKEIYNNRSDEYGKYLAQLKEIHEEILSLNKSIDELKKNNVEKEDKIKTTTKQVNDTKLNAETYGKESTIFKVSSAVIAGGLIGSVVDIFIQGNKVKQLQDKITQYDYYLKSFERVAEKEVDFELFKRLTGKGLERKTCSTGSDKRGLAACSKMHPTITTITAKGGYRFGGVLFIEWPIEDKSYVDPKAFTFSDFVAGITTHIPDSKSIIVDPKTILTFGNSDINILLDNNGTVDESSFMIPKPYTHVNFYVPGTKFTVESIRVDRVTGFE